MNGVIHRVKIRIRTLGTHAIFCKAHRGEDTRKQRGGDRVGRLRPIDWRWGGWHDGKPLKIQADLAAIEESSTGTGGSIEGEVGRRTERERHLPICMHSPSCLAPGAAPSAGACADAYLTVFFSSLLSPPCSPVPPPP